MAAIKNDEGYVHILKWYSIFMREARKSAKEAPPASVDPLLHKASADAMESQADILAAQLDEYEKEVREGKITSDLVIK